MTDLIGLELGGYRVTGHLARGGFAEIYTVEGPSGSAVLKLGRERGGRPNATAAFAMADATAVEGGAARSVGPEVVDALLCEEGELLQAADGAAGLPRLLGQVEHAGRPGLVLELVPGESLAAARRAGQPLPLSSVVDLSRALADAIARGAIPAHGDLKPANLMLSAGALRPIDPGVQVESTVAATPAFSPLLQRSPDGDRIALAASLYAYAAGSAPFPSPAPGRACAGDRPAWRAFLALHVPPLVPREGLTQPLIDLIQSSFETALERRGVDGLRQLADDLELVIHGGCDLLSPTPPVRAALPPGVA